VAAAPRIKTAAVPSLAPSFPGSAVRRARFAWLFAFFFFFFHGTGAGHFVVARKIPLEDRRIDDSAGGQPVAVVPAPPSKSDALGRSGLGGACDCDFLSWVPTLSTYSLLVVYGALMIRRSAATFDSFLRVSSVNGGKGGWRMAREHWRWVN
jgi:hypothetical protein